MIPNIERPRLRKLPSGTWTVRKQINGRRIEVALGTSDEAVAMERARGVLRAIIDKHVSETWAETVETGLIPTAGWLWRLWNNATRRRPDSAITLNQLRELALRSAGSCEVSGVRFVLGRKMHPFQPSLDRLVGGHPYTIDNIRLVALAVNFCMGRWGKELFRSLSITMARRYLEQLEAERGIATWLGAHAGMEKIDPNAWQPTLHHKSPMVPKVGVEPTRI